jgi:hypothetical protein
MNQELQDRIEDYLDGRLDDEAARRFEQDLLKKDVAAEFREALLLRELLGSLPPEQPPEGLVQRIESALIQDRRERRERRDAGQQSDTAATRPAGGIVAAFKTGLRWPGYALAGLMGGPKILKESAGGLQTIGYSLGPLREPARRRIQAISLPRKPLWKIALAKTWQGITP